MRMNHRKNRQKSLLINVHSISKKISLQNLGQVHFGDLLAFIILVIFKYFKTQFFNSLLIHICSLYIFKPSNFAYTVRTISLFSFLSIIVAT